MYVYSGHQSAKENENQSVAYRANSVARREKPVRILCYSAWLKCCDSNRNEAASARRDMIISEGSVSREINNNEASATTKRM